VQKRGIKQTRGPTALAELVGGIIDPVTARRGFATAELIAGWADIVGARYADCSRPEKIIWPRGKANEEKPGTLIIAVEGPRALLLQHEADQIIERVNHFVGLGAIGRIKITQGPVSSPPAGQKHEEVLLQEEDIAQLADTLEDFDSPELRDALDRLGRAILAERNKKS
jgi:hypothetical protein